MASKTNATVTLPLEGVESEHCALIVNKGLEKVEGISSHRIELNNKRAIIDGNISPEVIANSVTAIRDLGYEVPTLKRTFPVLQMTCASCAISVESMLKAQAGVVKAVVNYAAATVSIEFIPEMVQPADLRQAVQSIGYDLLIEEEHMSETLEDIHGRAYRALRVRTLWAILFSIPVVVIGMFFMDILYANYIMWVLSSPVILWLGKSFFINAWKQAKHGSANMDTLVALSTGVAYLFSVFNTLFPHYWHARGLHGHVYFESGAVVIAFILLGKLLEEKAKGSTSAAMKKLMGLQPKTVTVIHPGGHEQEIPVEKVAKGDVILVKPGDKVAVDGTVLDGSSYVDESMLSGEPVAVLKHAGADVFAGTINQKGSFTFRANKVGAETMLAQIIKMVQDAQGSKAPVQKLVDRIAGIFVPVVIFIALLTFGAWMLLGGENGFTHGLISLVTVLVIACPCALGLATPTAIMVGVGKGAEQGILIQNAESLELAKKINVVVLDKTGTITEGKPMVTQMVWLDENDAHRQAMLSLEKQSEHPLADAIVNYLSGVPAQPVTGFESITGMGATAEVNGETYYAGNKKLLTAKGILIDAKLTAATVVWEQQAKTVIWFANQHQALAVVAIADKIKPNSMQAIQQLRESGIEVYMLTGDNQATAEAVSAQVGITRFKAEVMPGEKVEFIRQLQAQGKVVAMAGDGVNDSAALAQADVSIAMGKGSDIAKDVAKMTIVSSDLNKIPAAIQLSSQTVATIKQNLFWAFIYNLIGIPLAAGVLYPVNGFLLDPMIAGAAMALSSVSVVGNSLRLKLKKNYR